MAKKSLMKNSTKKKLLTAMFIVLAIFILLVLTVPQITVGAEAAQWQLDFVQWFVDLKDNLSANYGYYLLIGGAGVAAYYFLVFRPGKK